MVKNVGKMMFLLVCYSWQMQAASIDLQIFDVQNNELASVGVGVPFILKVSMQGFKKKVHEPLIPHLALIGGVRVGDGQGSMIMRNNQSTMYYNYKARIDTPGSYMIGPVSIDNDGDMVSSKELVIEAGQMVALNSSRKHKHKEKPLFFDFSVDAAHVVVGQKIVCMARFYFNQDSGFTGHAQFGMPDVPGFVVGAIEVGEGAETIKGTDYRFVEWRWSMYSQQAGATMVPACRVDYVVEVTRQNVSQGWRHFFNSRHSERLHSNSVHLVIDPLPPHDIPVVGVGTFNELSVTMDPSVIKEGAAAVLTVELKGNGNAELIDQFQLVGMPESVKYYESKKYMVPLDLTSTIPRKRFEFILQGLRAGEGEIPEQQFTYFDVQDQKYATLISAPVAFSVTPAALKVSAATVSGDRVNDKEVELLVGDKVTPLPLNTTGPWYPVQERSPLSLWFFILALLAPFAYLFCRMLVSFIHVYYQNNELQVRARRAFTNARLAVKECKQNHTASALYGLCIRLIAHRCMVPEAVVSRSWIISMLKSRQYNQQEIEGIDKLLEKLTHYAFAQGAGKLVDNDIYAQVEQWISWLEKKL